jgi:hypothetical protein
MNRCSLPLFAAVFLVSYLIRRKPWEILQGGLNRIVTVNVEYWLDMQGARVLRVQADM